MSRNAPILDSLIISILFTRLKLQAKPTQLSLIKASQSMITKAQRAQRAQSDHKASKKSRPIPSHSHLNHLIKRRS
jgi:hypothetical protein